MTENLVLLEREKSLVTLTLNRPERRNALDQEMIDALHKALDELWDDPEVGVVLFTGEAKGSKESRREGSRRVCLPQDLPRTKPSMPQGPPPAAAR